MKVILCTLAICLSILASFFTTRVLIRDEGKRTRASFSKALSESPDVSDPQKPFIQKMDTLNSQLASLNHRVSALENAVRDSQSATANEDYANLQSALVSLTKQVNGMSAALTRFDGIPTYLAGMTTFLDQSFKRLEKTAGASAAPETMTTALDDMSRKIDDIDGYFTPLYAFLGLVYDPDNSAQVAAYPSLDKRINELSVQIEAVRQDIADFREWATPRNIDTAKRPR